MRKNGEKIADDYSVVQILRELSYPRLISNMSVLHYSDVIMSAVASNHRCLDCLINPLFRRRSKKTSKPRVTCLCEGNSPVTGEFPAQRASNAENISSWWRHYMGKGGSFYGYKMICTISVQTGTTHWQGRDYFLTERIWRTIAC